MLSACVTYSYRGVCLALCVPIYIIVMLLYLLGAHFCTHLYNFLKGTHQHALPVGEFMDRLSRSDGVVEANLTSVFQCMHGSSQYWYTHRSELLCMVRLYGSPSIFLTLSCAEYDNPEIDSYLKKVNKVSSSYPISRLCTEDAMSVSRLFSHQFHSFFQTVIIKSWVVSLIISVRRNTSRVVHHTITYYCGLKKHLWLALMRMKWYSSGFRRGLPAAYQKKRAILNYTSLSPSSRNTNVILTVNVKSV